MNIKETSMDKRRRARRVLAFWCAMLMLVLQCFVMAAVMDPASAASPSLKITVVYKDGKTATKSVSLDKIKKQKPQNQYDIDAQIEVEVLDDEGNPVLDDEGNPVTEIQTDTKTVKTVTLKQILKVADVGSGVKYVSYPAGDDDAEIDADYFDDIRIIYPGQTGWPGDDKYRIYYEGELWNALEKVSVFKANKEDTTAVRGVSISPRSLYLYKGKSQTIKVTIDRDEFYKNNGKAPTVTYKTSNKKIATVDSKGKVTAKKTGSVKITVVVKSGTKEYKTTANVTVREKPTTRKYTTYHHYRPSTRYQSTTRYYTTPTTRAGMTTSPTQPSSLTPTPGKTMTVKEVYLKPVDSSALQEEEDEVLDESDEDSEWTDEDEEEDLEDEEDWDEDGVDFGAAAGSAAVAAAACGAGAVGRIRRYRVDMNGQAEPKEKASGKTKEKKPRGKTLKKK